MKLTNCLRINILSAVLLVASILNAVPSYAHFLWVYRDQDSTRIVLGEDPGPDQASFLDALGQTRAFQLSDDSDSGVWTPREWERQQQGDFGWLQLANQATPDQVDVNCPYGVFSRGETAMLLDYSAKYLKWTPQTVAIDSGKLPLNILPVHRDGEWAWEVRFQGRPVSDAEIQIRSLPQEHAGRTDQHGQFPFLHGNRWLVRAKWVLPEGGTYDGLPYDEKRYYCTLVLDIASDLSNVRLPAFQQDSVSLERQPTLERDAESGRPDQGFIGLRSVRHALPEFPLGMTSFGAVAQDGHWWIFGGKKGKAHDYARDYQNASIYHLNVEPSRADQRWEIVGQRNGLQGLATVSDASGIYVIGGLEARNDPGQPESLHSVDRVEMFDTATGQWRTLPALPQPRSSLAACRLGRELFVVGGWTLKGDRNGTWATDGLRLDLDRLDQGWQTFPVPFRTRALALLSQPGSLIAVGGMQAENGPTNETYVFDVGTESWKQVAEVPAAGPMKSFGCAGLVHQGHAVVSTYDGGIYLWQAGQWSKIHELDHGRFFHQLLPVSESQFAVVGGAHMEIGRPTAIEVLEWSPTGDPGSQPLTPDRDGSAGNDVKTIR